MRRIGCLFFCSLILFEIVTCNYQESTRSQKITIMSAYSDGVINGAEIYFFADKTMQYESLSLIGTDFYYGTYTILNDTFFVEYNNDKPSLDFTKMIVENDNLIFLNFDNSDRYPFNLISNQ